MPGNAVSFQWVGFLFARFLSDYHSVAKIPDLNFGSIPLIKSLSKSVHVFSPFLIVSSLIGEL